MFQILKLEHPEIELDWRVVEFPVVGQPLLEGADVGLFLEPPSEPGLRSLVLGSEPLVVTVAVGHALAAADELRVADVLDHPFPGTPNAHPEWRAFWTLDAQRDGPGPEPVGEVANPAEGLELVADGRAIATLPASTANGLSHPGVVSIPLTDARPAQTKIVWRSDDANPAVAALVSIAADVGGNGL
jgi:DNA-binding transcriptional LysR family regulator